MSAEANRFWSTACSILATEISRCLMWLSPTADHPAQHVSWYDVVMYCNWLNLREGLKPCYERTMHNRTQGGGDTGDAGDVALTSSAVPVVPWMLWPVD
jgi:hypothetical protein